MAHPIFELDAWSRAATATVATLSTLYVDDEDDTLDALHAAAMRAANPHPVAMRSQGLEHMPTNLSAWATSSRWPTPVRPARRRKAPSGEAWMMGTVFSAAIAVLLAVSALLWRIERPRAVPQEHTPAAIVLPASAVDAPDAISGATRR